MSSLKVPFGFSVVALTIWKQGNRTTALHYYFAPAVSHESAHQSKLPPRVGVLNVMLHAEFGVMLLHSTKASQI